MDFILWTCVEAPVQINAVCSNVLVQNTLNQYQLNLCYVMQTAFSSICVTNQVVHSIGRLDDSVLPF